MPTEAQVLRTDCSADSAANGRTCWRMLANFILLCPGWLLTPLHAEDWPQWRGVQRDGVWRETGIAAKLPAGQLPLKWRYPLAAGYSGPTVAEGRVFVTDRIRQPGSQERIHCVDEATGKQLWMYAYDCEYANVGYEAGPRASVSIDNGRAYSLGAMGHLLCLDAATGAVQWQRNLVQELEVPMPIWGISASPLVDGNRLIVHIGGKDAGIVALDKLTGDMLWKALPDQASYSAPIITTFGDNRVLVVWTADSVSLLDPVTGKVHARHPFPPSQMPIGAATPIVQGNQIFVSSFYDGSLMLTVDPDALTLTPAWRRIGASEQKTESLHCMISTPVWQGDYIYGVDSYGELRCLNAKTGDRIWEDLTLVPKARWSCVHLVKQADRYWMFNERGELVVGTLAPTGLAIESRAKLIAPTTEQLNMRGGVCWSHPAFANRNVYARNDEELVAASLAE